MENLWEAVSPNVFRVASYFRTLAFSPSGALIAARGAGGRRDLPASDSLRVFDAIAPREVTTLDDRSALLAFGWVDDERLLVARAHGQSVRVAVHEMPDGGEVASIVLPDAPRIPMSVEVSSDRRRAVLRGNDRMGATAYLVAIDVGEMKLLREIRNLPSGGMLNGDGTWLAVASRELRLYALDDAARDEVSPIVASSWWTTVTLRSWPSPDVLLGTAGASRVRLERTPEGVVRSIEPPTFDASLPDFQTTWLLLGRAALPTRNADGVVLREGEQTARFSLVEKGAFGAWTTLPDEETPSRAVLREHPRGVSVGLVGPRGTRLFVLHL